MAARQLRRNMAQCLVETRDFSCDHCHGLGAHTEPGQGKAVAELCPTLKGCAVCKGSGYRYVEDADGYRVAKPCELAGIRRRIELFNHAGLPSRCHDALLARYKPESDAQAAAKQRVETMWKHLQNNLEPNGKVPPGTRGIGLWGPPGVGKTHLLTALARRLLLDLGMQVKYTDFSGLLWDLKAGFGTGRGEDQLIAPLVEVDVLFVDELGKGRASEWEISVLDAIVCGRYDRKKLTFCATNYAVGQADRGVVSYNSARDLLARKDDATRGESLEDRVSDRVASRLYDLCDWQAVDGPDARRQGAQTRAPVAIRGRG